jgi:hypothetical protein
MMLKIRKSEDRGRAIFTLSGRIEEEHLSELRELLDDDAKRTEITLDLKEVRLADRGSVRFLAACEARGIRLLNCPPYIREWIATGRGKS